MSTIYLRMIFYGFYMLIAHLGSTCVIIICQGLVYDANSWKD